MSKPLKPIYQKILLLLLGGITLGLSGSPRQYYKTLKVIGNDWKRIKEDELKKTIKDLYRSKMVEFIENKDGTCTIVLSETGKKKALSYSFDDLVISKPDKWDGKWRIALFDIPEYLKKKRNALRNKLKDLGFFEFQKSVFVFPYDCKNEIDFVIEFLEIKPYVRFIIAESLDNELHLKKKFNLI